jgi:hypothetical protein
MTPGIGLGVSLVAGISVVAPGQDWPMDFAAPPPRVSCR